MSQQKLQVVAIIIILLKSNLFLMIFWRGSLKPKRLSRIKWTVTLMMLISLKYAKYLRICKIQAHRLLLRPQPQLSNQQHLSVHRLVLKIGTELKNFWRSSHSLRMQSIRFSSKSKFISLLFIRDMQGINLQQMKETLDSILKQLANFATID